MTGVQTCALPIFGLGSFGFAPIGLLLGDLFGRMISMGALGRMIGRDLWPLLRSARSRGMLRGALRYRRFATFSSGAVLVDVGATFLPAAFVSDRKGTRLNSSH